DEVTLHDKPVGAIHLYSRVGVSGNEVACPRRGTADRVVAGALRGNHADLIRQWAGTGHVGTDEVSLDDVLVGARAKEQDTAADRVAGRVEVYAPGGVTQRLAAGDVGADEVALDGVGARLGSEFDAGGAVSGNDVPRGGRGPADGVPASAANEHPWPQIAQARFAVRRRADQIALYQSSARCVA